MSRNRRDNFRQKSLTQRFLSILGLAIFFFYFCLGLAVILWEEIPLDIDPFWRKMFGALIIAYSFFRFARLWASNFRD